MTEQTRISRNKPEKCSISLGPHSRYKRRSFKGSILSGAMLLILVLLCHSANGVCTAPTSLSPPSSPLPYTYNIGASSYSFTIPAWTQGTDCTYTETLSFSPDLATLAWISVLGREVTINSSDTFLH